MSDGRHAWLAIAGLAVGACAVGGIAYTLGWLPWGGKSFEIEPPKKVAAAPQAAISPSGVVLLPGETLVAPPDPVMAPAPPPSLPAAIAPEPAKKPAPAPSPPRYNKPVPPPVIAQSPPPRAQPPARAPRDERRELSYERSTRSVCINCGVVTGIARNDYDWEVRVRYDDGRRATHRVYDRPRFELGDAVRLEDGRLFPD